MVIENKKVPDDCADMTDIRAEIDHLDEAIIALISRRAAYVQAAAAFKTSATAVKAPERFRTMLQQRRLWAEEHGLNPDVIEQLFRDLVQHFIQEEMQRWKQHHT